MNCYDCAANGAAQSAVGICALCGAAVCSDHGVMQSLPQFRQSSGGIGGPTVRVEHARRRLVCADCAAHSWPGKRGVYCVG